ncbi:MAG: hypothetical protein ABF453_02985 [Bifidobacterium psychraerophilum]|uniref:hypothetical protein n=1 Tax=Bifidobacterium psychraerophilum TaxID=218140 RepID=UPI0039EA8B50
MTQEQKVEIDQYGNKTMQLPNWDVYDCVGGMRIVYFPDDDAAQLHILDADNPECDAAYTNLNHDGLIAVRDFINAVLEEKGRK